MSYEVPSDARDQRILRKQNEDLRNIIRIIPQSTNENTDGGGFDGLAGASGINSGYLTGSFVITSPEEQQAVKISWTSGRSVTGKRLLHVGDYVATNAGITGTNWIGRITYITTTESDVSGTCICEPQLKKFNKPSDGARSAFNSGSTTSLTKIKWVASSTGGEGDWAEYANSDEDYDDRWTATYNASGFSNQEVVISTGSMIIDNREGGTDVEIKNILGNLKDGQMLTVKPKDGMTLTLKTGGNIDGDNETVIKDTDIAILQYHEDGGSKWRAVGGSGDGLSTVVKEPCRVASTGNNALHPVYNVTIDGVTLVEGDRLLIKNQTTQRDNGIYVCGGVTLGASTFTRAEDFDEDSEVKSGVLVAVNEGTDNGNTLWALTSDGNLTVGTSALVFTKMTVDSSLDYTWSGKNLYVNATEWNSGWDTDAEKQTNCQVKFQGDGLEHSGYSDNASQRVLEIGKYGTHEVKIIAEITGEGDAVISDPDGAGTFTIPNSDPSVSFKTSLVMNTYDIYDLDKMVFAQGVSTTAPPMLNNWVGIQANTGEDTSGGSSPPSPVLNGMALHVPDNKKFFFKIGKGTSGEEAEGSNVHDAFKVSENGIEIGSSSVPSSLSNGMIWHNSSDNKVYVRSNGATVEVGGSGSGVQLTDNPTWTGNHVWDTSSTWDGSTVPVKFQGDGANTSQTIMELGKHGNHSVKVIAELTGEGNAVITDPDGTGTYTIPNSDPSISMKACLVMNTYTMYDLDTVVFSQGVSTTTPAPLADWVWIEANTGTGSSPVLTGMHYNVPSGKTHQFKVNGAEQVIIENGGISPPTSGGKNLGSPTLEWNTLYLSNGLYFGTGQENNTLYNVNGMHFNIGSTSDWYEFDIGTTNNTKLQIKDDKIIAHEHLLPITDEDYDLGSSSYQWHNIWGKTLQGVAFVDFETSGAKIQDSSGSLQLEVGTGKSIKTVISGSVELTVSSDGLYLASNNTPSTLLNGMVWNDGTDVHVRTGGATKNLSDIGSGGGGVGLGDNNVWTGTNKFTQHVTLGNGDNLLPEDDVGSNLGDSTHAFSLVYFRNLFLDDPNIWIKYVSGDMVLNTKSGNNIIFKEDDTTFFYLDGANNDVRFSKEVEFNADVRMDGGNVFRSQDSAEIGYYVTDTDASTGVQGTQQLPYWESTSIITSQQSSTTLDSKFGNQTGCSGIQYDSSESAGSGKYRLWVKTEGSGTGSGKWVKTELS